MYILCIIVYMYIVHYVLYSVYDYVYMVLSLGDGQLSIHSVIDSVSFDWSIIMSCINVIHL